MWGSRGYTGENHPGKVGPGRRPRMSANPAIAIKPAYRRLARDYHPDLHPKASDDERRALAQRFVEVTAAYQTLVA